MRTKEILKTSSVSGNNGLTFRRASTTDIPSITEMTALLAVESEDYIVDRVRVAKYVAEILDDPFERARYWLVVNDVTVVGQLFLWDQPFPMRGGPCVWIDDVFVAPAYRNRGLFKMLLTHVCDVTAEEKKSVGLRLIVMLRNSNGLRTYLKQRFEPDGHLVLARWTTEVGE